MPYGAVLSYRDLARRGRAPQRLPRRGLGHGAQRAARGPGLPPRGKNDGRLGYYGDDPAWKARLLALEGVAVRRDRLDPARSTLVVHA